MAESFDYKKEGRRIAAAYLNRLGWIGEQKRFAAGEVRTLKDREVLEEKFRQAQEREEEAGGKLAEEVDVWLKSKDPMRFVVLEEVYQILEKRGDLDFFGKQTLTRLKKALPPV
jgi:hypothetical protein